MLKNKIIVKKIRNIFILLMAIIIMFGAYHNIRNSRAENVIQIELEVADKSGVLSAQILTIDATETSDGKYIANLPISVNKNMVTKYYTSSGEEIVVDAENNVAMVQLTQDEVNNKKMQVQTDYDTKEVTVDGKTETLYKKELTNEPAATENNAESTEKIQDQNETINDENQNVVVTGYMPLDAKLEVKEIDAADLTAVKIPSETQTVQKGYEISIYQMVEKQNSEDNTAVTDKTTNDDTISDENSTIDTNTENTNTESTQEKVEYNLDTYGEDITIKTKYDQTNEVATVYSLDENNKATLLESTIEENKVAGQTDGTVENTLNEVISFTIGKTDDTVKYVIATEEKDNEKVIYDEIVGDEVVSDEITSNIMSVAQAATVNYLKSTSTEKTSVAGFLGNTTIKRRMIESITFVNSISGANSTKWDVSAAGDGRIMAWYTGSGPYQVYIGSASTIFANKDSSYLFSYIGFDETCTATTVIKNINLLNVSKTTNMDYMFYNTGWRTMTSLSLGSNFDTSNVTSMSNMFAGVGYTAMKSFSLGSKFDTSKVTNMEKMFRSAGRKSLAAFSLGSKFNTSSVTNMSNMFAYYGTDLMVKLDLGELFDTSNVNNMESMFENCGYTSMTTLDLGDNFDTSKVSNMKMMFMNCGYTSMKILDLGIKFTRIPNVSGTTSLHENMLEGCGKDGETIIYVPEDIYGDRTHMKLNASVTTRIEEYTRGTIRTRRYLKSASALKETTATSGFLGNTTIHREDISSVTFLDNIESANSTKWDVSEAGNNSILAWYEKNANGSYKVYIGSDNGIYANVTASYLFAFIGSSSKCTEPNVINNIDLLNVTRSTAMQGMFSSCGLNAMKSLDLGTNFNTRFVGDMSQMFLNCGRNAMESLNLGDKFRTSKVTNMRYMFAATGYTKMTSLNLGSLFSTYLVTDMAHMFQNCGYTAMTTLTLGSNFNTSSVTDMSYMFINCGYKALGSLNLGSNFNTSNVTDMSYMFSGFGYTALKGKFSLGTKFDTSKVTNMSYMFRNCGYTAMTEIELGSLFNTSKVTDMSYMFQNCGRTAMPSISLGSLFDTSNVTNMSYMFYGFGYTALTSLDLSAYTFNTSKVTNMSHMFQNCGYTAMTTLNLGTQFNTSKVTDMSYMFYATGNKALTSLNLQSNFSTSIVTDMSYMFFRCGYTSMTNLTLGSKFNTSKVTNMNSMFQETGYTKMTSLNLGKSFYTTAVTDTSNMFKRCGETAMTTLDLGPAFTKIGATYTEMFANTGKSGAKIYAPESIYSNRTNFKLSSTSTTKVEYQAGTFTDSVVDGNTVTTFTRTGTRGTIQPKYRPEWSVTGTTVDTTNKALKIDIKGATNTSNYTSNVTTALKATDISVWIDDTELTGITKTVSVANPTTASSVTHTITITNFEVAAKQAGKSYKEWSGNITLKIGGREDATSTYSKKVLKDAYGNQSMSKIDTSGTWVDINFKDTTKSSVNTSGKLFADVVNPAIIYEYSNTTINYGTKTVTIDFDITDKYFNSSTLDSDTSASKITVTVDGKKATNAKKTLSKISDIKETVDGNADIKVGEKYRLVITNLDQGKGGDYSGIMKLNFEKDIATDKSNNKNIATTITIGIDNPTTGDGHNSGKIVDVVSPIWKTKNLVVNKTNQKATFELIATDKYLTDTSSSTLTNDNIDSNMTLIVDGKTVPSSVVSKSIIDGPTFSSNSTTGLMEIKYTIELSGWEQSSKQSGETFYEYSGTTKITMAAGIITDENTNKSRAQTLTLGHIDVIKPKIEKVSSTPDKTAKTETIIFNVIDKYLDTTDAVTLSEIKVYIDGVAVQVSATATSGKITGKLTRVTANDVSAEINGTSQVVSQQYKLVLSDFEQVRNSNGYKDWSGTVKIEIVAGAVKDVIPEGAVSGGNTNVKTTITGDFVDFILPEIIYEYANTTIDHTNKTVTVVFDVIDKYFSSSDLSSDTTASKITVTIGGKTISTDKKSLSHTDINKSVNGTTKKVGEKYTLVVNDLDLGAGGDYSGIMKMAFGAGRIKDTSSNGNVAKTITIGIDDPTTGDGHTSGVVVDVVSPVWITRNLVVDKTNKKATVDLIATDKYLTSKTNSTLTTNNITVSVDGDVNANKTIEKELSEASDVTSNSTTGLKEIKYTLTLSNWEQTSLQSGKSFLEWSGTTNITIAAGVITDQYTNKSKEQTLTLGHIDVIKPRIEKVPLTDDERENDKTAKTETIVFNVVDKYLDTTDEVTANEITVYVDGEKASTLTKTLSRVTENDKTATVNGISQVVSQQYKLVLSNFEQSTRNAKDYKDWSGTVRIDIAAGAVKDKTSGNSVNINNIAKLNGDFVDFVMPNIKYEPNLETDIDERNRAYTMTFSITDKYFNTYSTISLDNLDIKMRSGKLDQDGKEIIYDLKNVEGVTIALSYDEISATNVNVTRDDSIVTVSSLIIGHRYTLKISNLERVWRFDLESGQTTRNYSGIITVAFKSDSVVDKNGNWNINTTITSRARIAKLKEDGTLSKDSDGNVIYDYDWNNHRNEVVDVVRPIWFKSSSTANISDINTKNQYATIVFKGTDTNYAGSTPFYDESIER